MIPPLRILLVEDSTLDAILLENELLNIGLDAEITRVETEAEIRAALLLRPELVLSDYSLEGFTAFEVLDWFRQSGADAPFILVSGTIDTETAISAMRQGASDYILKSNLPALGGAIHRAIEAHALRRAKTEAEEKILFLARMLDLASDAIIVCDFEHRRIQHWNNGAEKLYGWTVGEVLGESIDQILKSDPPATEAMVENLLQHGGWNTEGYRQLRDGREIAVSERATLERDPEGKPRAILFIHNDITHRRAAEEQIHYQEALLRETGAAAKIGSWELHVSTSKLYWTPEVARIYGLQPEDPVTLEVGLSFYRGENFRKIDDAVKAAIQNAVPYDLELEITTVDETKKWIRTVGQPVVEDGKVVRLKGIFQDITAQKRFDDQLREQARLLDLTTDAIIVSDFNTRKIIYWNRGAERMHGWKAEEVVGQQAVDLLLLDRDAGEEIIREINTRGEWNGEIRERTKDHREIIVDARITLVRDEAGQPTSMLSIHTDVTERKAMEAQFLRAQRLESVGILASGVAHDLNNILSPIILAAPVLEDELKPEARKEIVEIITASARRGVEIVRQVLMFARGMKGQRVAVNSKRLIEEIALIAEETFPKSIVITAHSSLGVWPTLGDSTQLQQILLNLAINARDALPNGGSLSISARNFPVDDSFASMTPGATVGPHVLLEVKDTGTGIPKAVLGRVFDPFFSTKEVGKGTGLGLSTVLGIVKSHGGFMSVESKQGQGTTFKVFIPAALGAADQESTERPVITAKGKDELVLLVDDEVNIRIVAEAVLKQAGYRVVLAANGPEAIARYAERRQEFDVVITDAVMPFLDGAGLIRVLRNLNPDIKVIGTSGYGDDVRARDLQSLGVQAFLAKPYDKSTLLNTLHGVLHEIRS